MKWCQVYIDMDGTICGKTEWKGLWWNTKQLFKGIKYTPPSNMSWTLLTSRPRIDAFIINLVCYRYSLQPINIITAPTWFYNFKDTKSVANWKYSILAKSLNHPLVNKVVYIDDDHDLLSHMPVLKGLQVCNSQAAEKIINSLGEN